MKSIANKLFNNALKCLHFWAAMQFAIVKIRYGIFLSHSIFLKNISEFLNPILKTSSISK